MRRMREGDQQFFFKFYRMSPALFDELLGFVAADLTRQHFIREPQEPGEKLAITLSYLASGLDICNVALAYRVGIETDRRSIHVTCRASLARLKDHFMKVPTKAEWAKIAGDFTRRWQFPNCLGAVDGKHVAITCPPKSGSAFFNYKGTFSIVLMAVVDSSSKFVLVDIGAEGRQSDGGVFKNTKFGKALTEGQLDIPSLGQLPGTTKVAPYAFVGDEGFQLRRDFMRPFPARLLEDERRVFNYRLSRARRCAENAFGITAARWRILLRTIQLLPKNVDYVVKAACVLHNFLAVLNEELDQILDQEDRFGNVVPGRWRQGIQQTSGQGHVDPCYFSLQGSQSRNFSADAADARTLFSAYFCSSAGEVTWQWHQPGVSKQGALKRLEEQGLHPFC
ncbi:hypothetical protein HPB51_028680 [Rhipicephalus microplus]|uniref:DDE Tnp4 domain-containing protein n=1 Tax=Rhipicephalus microplus TaxID=6941 RepID=A0A9J6CWX9_RHIMP|nr:protein ANTAGONIST OF LIKE HETEROCHROMATIN PROTEIN 1-like [Rhipicephalus microplus]KAH7942637.1 hypothetical protein HPB51_028680 [Rhipicephalus microplus]